MSNPTSVTDVAPVDRLMTRPDDAPLPAAQDPKASGTPTDPRPVPKTGQGTDPKATDLDHTA